MKVYTENCKILVKSWCEAPEQGAILQATNYETKLNKI